MNEQTRFAILVGGIAVVVVGLWWLLWRPAPSPRESTVPSSVTERERDDTPPEVSAPAGRREARPSQRITGGAVGTRRESLTGEDQIAGTPQSGIGTVKGEVLWADSKARVEGAEVIAEIQDYHEGEKPPTVSARWRTVTGPDGKFLIERLPEFRALLDQNVYYRLYARTDDAFGESGFQLTDDEPSAYEKIELYPAGTISGRVINAEGQPVANAWLSPPVPARGVRARHLAPLEQSRGQRRSRAVYTRKPAAGRVGLHHAFAGLRARRIRFCRGGLGRLDGHA